MCTAPPCRYDAEYDDEQDDEDRSDVVVVSCQLSDVLEQLGEWSESCSKNLLPLFKALD